MKVTYEMALQPSGVWVVQFRWPDRGEGADVLLIGFESRELAVSASPIIAQAISAVIRRERNEATD